MSSTENRRLTLHKNTIWGKLWNWTRKKRNWVFKWMSMMMCKSSRVSKSSKSETVHFRTIICWSQNEFENSINAEIFQITKSEKMITVFETLNLAKPNFLCDIWVAERFFSIHRYSACLCFMLKSIYYKNCFGKASKAAIAKKPRISYSTWNRYSLQAKQYYMHF